MPKRILIAEDEDDIREEVLAVLQEAGYEVEAAATGNEAIEKAKANPFDLIVTDFNMPNGTAKVVLDYVKGTQPKLPVIIMSGSALSWGMGKLARVEGILPKPFEPQKLLGTVEAALRDAPFGSLE